MLAQIIPVNGKLRRKEPLSKAQGGQIKLV
jgi:hypothetical protein